MAYLIFNKDLPNISGTLYRIAENETDLNNFGLNLQDFNVITITQDIFDSIRLNNKVVAKYNNNNVVEYDDYQIVFKTVDHIHNYNKNFSKKIEEFLNNNPNHPDFNKWSNYKNQLDDTKYQDLTFPLNKTLEQIYKDKNQTYFNIFEIK
jgi:hypothetical protein